MRLTAVLMAGALVAASCDGTGPSSGESHREQGPSVLPTVAQPPELPPGQDFYVFPPEIPYGEPGRLVRIQTVDAPEGTNGWRVLYHSQAVDGRDTVVSGLVFAPDEPAGANTNPVVAWAHGTVGLGDACAPSRSPQDLLDRPLLSELLARGYVVVATDYEGLGTPGAHPWLVGISEGRSVLDGVRAAGQVAEAHAGDQFMAVGASQGGGAALFAGELASEYAAELQLLGVAAVAPAAELDLLALAVGESQKTIAGYLVMGAFGFKAAYPDLPLQAILAEDVIAQREQIESMCQRQIMETFAGYSHERLLVRSPADVQSWAAAIAENTPGRQATPAPVLLVHGDQDQVVPPMISQLLLQRLCSIGVQAERREYPGVGHGGVLAASAEDLLGWIQILSAGGTPGPAEQGCS